MRASTGIAAPRQALWLCVHSREGARSWWHGNDGSMEEVTAPPPRHTICVSLSPDDYPIAVPAPVSTRRARQAMRRHLGGSITLINASKHAGVLYGRRREHDGASSREVPAGLLVEVLLHAREEMPRPCIAGILLSGPAGPQQILALWFADAEGPLSDLQFTDNAERQASQIIAD